MDTAAAPSPSSELHALLAAAGYEHRERDTLQDAGNYLQLLQARQAQLQIEHQQLVAMMGPALALARKPETTRHMPDEAPLSYERWFETANIGMALALSDGSVVRANEKFGESDIDGETTRIEASTPLLISRPPPNIIVRPAPSLNRGSAVVRAPVYDEDDDEAPPPPPKKRRTTRRKN